MSVAPIRAASTVSPRAALRRAHGFTLIELIVTIAIAAVLIGVALPSFREIGISMTVSSTANDLVGAINLARTEAVKRGTDVSVESTSASADWSSGWIVKQAAETLRSYPALEDGYSVTTAAGTGGDDKQIVFNARGNLGSVSGFDIAVCRPDHNPSRSRHVQVAGSGAVTTKNTAPDSSCT